MLTFSQTIGLMFKKAIEIAQTAEMAARNSKQQQNTLLSSMTGSSVQVVTAKQHKHPYSRTKFAGVQSLW